MKDDFCVRYNAEMERRHAALPMSKKLKMLHLDLAIVALQCARVLVPVGLFSGAVWLVRHFAA